MRARLIWKLIFGRRSEEEALRQLQADQEEADRRFRLPVQVADLRQERQRRIARRWALRLEGMAAAMGMALRFLARDPLRHALIGLWYGLWLALGCGLVPAAAIPLGLIGAFVSLAWLEQEGII